MIDPELDNARRNRNQLRSKVASSKKFIEVHDGDPDFAKSIKIAEASLPAQERKLVDAEAEVARLEAETPMKKIEENHVRSFKINERTTLLTAEEIAAYPEMPDFLKRWLSETH